jgi:hypothetical protein
LGGITDGVGEIPFEEVNPVAAQISPCPGILIFVKFVSKLLFGHFELIF